MTILRERQAGGNHRITCPASSFCRRVICNAAAARIRIIVVVPITIERLSPGHAGECRALMLGAYAAQPEAFTSTVAERERLPLAWWQARLSTEPDAGRLVLGAFDDGELLGVVGLSFEQREKVRHKARDTILISRVPVDRAGYIV